MASKSINIAISIPLDMFRWLEKPENKKAINRSQVCQKAFGKLMSPTTKKIEPMSYLIMVFGMTFGVGSLMVAATGIFDFLMSLTFCLLGAVILLASIVVMIKEIRRVNVSHAIRR